MDMLIRYTFRHMREMKYYTSGHMNLLQMYTFRHIKPWETYTFRHLGLTFHLKVAKRDVWWPSFIRFSPSWNDCSALNALIAYQSLCLQPICRNKCLNLQRETVLSHFPRGLCSIFVAATELYTPPSSWGWGCVRGGGSMWTWRPYKRPSYCPWKPLWQSLLLLATERTYYECSACGIWGRRTDAFLVCGVDRTAAATHLYSGWDGAICPCTICSGIPKEDASVAEGTSCRVKYWSRLNFSDEDMI